MDKRIFDHGSVKKCVLEKCGHIVNDVVENTWQVQVHFVSTEEDFPYTLQKYIKPGLLWDGYSVRLADGKVIDDDKPNKHYVCSQKVWEYKNTDYKYLRQMLKEQVEMGYIDEEDI